jgi:hypothetical protein
MRELIRRSGQVLLRAMYVVVYCVAVFFMIVAAFFALVAFAMTAFRFGQVFICHQLAHEGDFWQAIVILFVSLVVMFLAALVVSAHDN